MTVRLFNCICVLAFTSLLGCKASPRRPANVPASGVWTEGVFIDCSVEETSRSNRCTVYNDSSGEVQVSGLFVLSGAGREAQGAELQYMAFDGRRILLRDARTLDPVLLVEFVVPGMANRLATLAGPGAVNCGRVTRNQDPRGASDCALKAFANKNAFYVSYDEQGWEPGDSFGFAGNSSGNLFFVEYSSWPWPVHAQPEGIDLTEDNHIRFGSCLKPPMLIKLPRGELSCVPPRE